MAIPVVLPSSLPMLKENIRQIPYDPSKYSGYAEYLIDSRSAGTRVYLSQPVKNGTVQYIVGAPRYAVKVVPANYMAQRKPHNIRNEAMILSKLSHTNIIDLISAVYDAKQDIYELHLPYVDLPLPAILCHPHFSAHPFPTYLGSPPSNPFPIQSPFVHEILTRSIMFQVLRALAYLHEQDPPIAHRDVNPGNILLTRNGTVKLVDFGVAWDPGLPTFSIAGEDDSDDINGWKEDPEDMCGQVATGPCRAPELMYSPKEYDAPSTDLWSTGVTMAIFYAPIRLGLGEDESSDSDSSSASSKDQHPPVSVRDTPGYTIPVGISSIPLNAMWKRDALFDATRGEIALLWSIFRMMGTPTQDSWPDFPGHREGSVIRFRDAEKQPLERLLPHLPSSSSNSRPLKIIEGFLKYPPNSRLTAKDALTDPWFVSESEGPLMLPLGYPTNQEAEHSHHIHEVDGKSLENILTVLLRAQEAFIETMELRDEWD